MAVIEKWVGDGHDPKLQWVMKHKELNYVFTVLSVEIDNPMYGVGSYRQASTVTVEIIADSNTPSISEFMERETNTLLLKNKADTTRYKFIGGYCAECTSSMSYEQMRVTLRYTNMQVEIPATW